MNRIQSIKVKNLLKQVLLFCCSVVLFSGLSACDDDDDNGTVNEKPSITVLMGFNGKGNNDYSALIYKAIAEWEKNPDVDMKVFYPSTNEEAIEIYKNWCEKTANGGRVLMVPANGQFEYMVNNTPLSLASNQQVLAFEMHLAHPIKGVECFEISHSGVSYLAGKMASKCKEAVVLVGHKTPMLEHATKCFQKGFGNDAHFQVHEISKWFDGFNKPEEAKRLAAQHRDAFILPLAGLSNEGVYEFLNECDAKDKIIAAGMDVDCNHKSSRIPFSYLVNIDKAINLYLQSWFDGEPWPSKTVLGLKSGITGIAINSDFKDIDAATIADLKACYNAYFDEACEWDKMQREEIQ